MMIGKVDSIIFDLDGTLWDTKEVTLRFINTFIEEHDGLEKIDMKVVEDGMGKTLEENSIMYFKGVDSKTAIEYTRKVFENINEYLYYCGGNVYLGVVDTIKKLSLQYKLYIVSNNTCKYIEAFLHSNNLEKYFSGYLGNDGDSTKAEKIKDIIDNYNISNPIYVGDTYKDLEASRSCLIPFVWVSYGFGKNIECDCKVDSIDKLLDL